MSIRLVSAFLVSLVCLQAQSAGPVIRMVTNQGNIDVQMLQNVAPLTVANFLRYVNGNLYNNTFFHRSVAGFIIQAGGYKISGSTQSAVSKLGTVRNEFSTSNTRGTIAMAKLGNDPNSASNEWFFNLGNNASNLNNQNGGFTVFGRIVDDAGLAVMDKIANLPVVNATSPFDTLPVLSASGSFTESNLVVISSMSVLGEGGPVTPPAVDNTPTPSLAANGVNSPSSFGARPVVTAGTFLEIYGSDLGGDVGRGWADSDFTLTGNIKNAPTTLEGVSVTVAGQKAFVNYVSKEQVNVQVPAGVSPFGSAPVIVTYKGKASAPLMVELKLTAPGVLAPASFQVDGKQFVAALRPDNSFVANGKFAGLPNAPAKFGEAITLYAIGMGRVANNPDFVAGKVAVGLNPMFTPLRVEIGGAAATVSYAGLAPGSVGLYQINLTVPTGISEGDLPVNIFVDSELIPQGVLFLPVVAR